MHFAVLSSPSILTSPALYVCDWNTTFPPVDARFPIIAAKAELWKFHNSALGSALIERGMLPAGNLNSTSIPIGIYHIGNASNYSGGPVGMPSWCLFIQFGSLRHQMIITTITIFSRSYIGNPGAWTEWGTNA